MVRSANELISDAYYDALIVARGYEKPSGDQLTLGLRCLNEILTEKTVDKGMIPFETFYEGNFIIGQEKYFIPGLIKIDTLTFYLQDVRFSMMFKKRNEYFGTNRVNDIQSLPWSWYFEEALGGGNLYVYFEPDQAYPFAVHGLFSLNTVTQFQDLELTLAPFYITYLEYATAERICSKMGYDLPATAAKTLRFYQSIINKKSRVMDLRLTQISTIRSRVTLDMFGYANLSLGWFPGDNMQ